MGTKTRSRGGVQPVSCLSLLVTAGQHTLVWVSNVWFIFTRTLLRYVWVFAIANPPVVCLSSVTYVRPTHGVETLSFGNRPIFSPLCTLATHDLRAKFYGDRPRGTLSVGGVKRKRCSKIERCHVRVSYLLICFVNFLVCYGSVQVALRQRSHMEAWVCQVVFGFLRFQTRIQPLAVSKGKPPTQPSQLTIDSGLTRGEYQSSCCLISSAKMPVHIVTLCWFKGTLKIWDTTFGDMSNAIEWWSRKTD